ncbi:TetR/AcrR family transcriptional regulator [Mycobacterium sp. ITM-2016-00318]|uniref:TetR/AcrR family transcriptional regulator n=1 Tax=Mycobacterium sp. ITM-2016-00318 TaxID=2099693 RepID=UPI000CF9AB71|nr:TetR/AcrR family transcriptional regulator [Mycobacterium sp. ITM-2016-00318]WNG91813.1 helix-turn-helix domain-containing protein [Mycobacterium sp. ITM-2016-00318]
MTTPTRRWARTDATQQRILDAATEVFRTRGFSAATMADIVERSGASIGSIYHHFGGKRELFLAIYDRLSTDVELRLAEAASTADDLDSQEAFAVHVRAYLTAIWENRQAAMMMASGDVPVDFEHLRRKNTLTFFDRWMGVLDVDSTKRGQLLSRVLIAILSEASLMVAACDKVADVEPISDATVEWIARLRT